MGLFIRIFIVALSFGIAILFQNYHSLSQPIPRPNLNPNEYWGPGDVKNYKEDKTIKPFDITTKPEIIEDLKAQLKRPLKLHEPLEGVGFEYGFNTKELEKVVKYWRDTYLPKWNERETYLKQFPHYKTQIQGLNIHYIHVKPKNTEGKKVLPLILLHGWPGSVREFYDIIKLLTTPNSKNNYIFEVVAPSLPGYGWSQGSSKVNFGPTQIAVVMNNLMQRIGHKQYFVQGGDWGSVIGASMAALFPENIQGYHSNMCIAGAPVSYIKMLLGNLLPMFFGPKDEHKEFYKPLSELFPHIMEEMGYFHIQATKPDTIGTALLQSPVGLAAYILEKFSTWTNIEYRKLSDGGITKRYTLDALLDNVMIYYVTESITTSQRLYSEAFSKAQRALQIERVAVTVPMGCSRFKHDIMHTPDNQLADRYNSIITSTHHTEGGHFAAFEVPKTLYDDFLEFVTKVKEVKHHEN